MKSLKHLKKLAKTLGVQPSAVRIIAQIEESNDRRRDVIEMRLEQLGYEIEEVTMSAIYVNITGKKQ